MQVGEERLVLAQAVVLLGDRLLDLQQQVGAAHTSSAVPRIVAPAATYSASGDRGAGAGAPLDDDLVAVADQLMHAGGGDGHPELVVLDLAGDADQHDARPSRTLDPRRHCRGGVAVRLGRPSECIEADDLLRIDVGTFWIRVIHSRSATKSSE